MELSYDPIIHKKVRADVFGLIPNGCKVLAWFTYNLSDNVCILLYINKYNIVTKTEQIVLCFNKELAYGTIIAGTYFNHKNQNFLVCEDIYYFKGEYIQNCDFKIKYNILTDILNNYIQQKAYTNRKELAHFGLPYYNMERNILEFNLDKFEDYLHKQKVNLPRVDLVIKCQNILKAKKKRGKFGNKSCVSWQMVNQNVDKDDLIIDGEYKEIVDETA